MKKYLVLSLLLCFTTLAAQETTISTNDINVPKDYATLKNLYIKAVLMYYKESDAHKVTLDQLKLALIDNSNMLAKLKDILDKGVYTAPIWKSYMSVSVGQNFGTTEKTLGIGVGYFGIYKDRWVIGADAIYPSFLGGRLGFGF